MESAQLQTFLKNLLIFSARNKQRGNPELAKQQLELAASVFVSSGLNAIAGTHIREAEKYIKDLLAIPGRVAGDEISKFIKRTILNEFDRCHLSSRLYSEAKKALTSAETTLSVAMNDKKSASSSAEQLFNEFNEEMTFFIRQKALCEQEYQQKKIPRHQEHAQTLGELCLSMGRISLATAKMDQIIKNYFLTCIQQLIMPEVNAVVTAKARDDDFKASYKRAVHFLKLLDTNFTAMCDVEFRCAEQGVICIIELAMLLYQSSEAVKNNKIINLPGKTSAHAAFNYQAQKIAQLAIDTYQNFLTKTHTVSVNRLTRLSEAYLTLAKCQLRFNQFGPAEKITLEEISKNLAMAKALIQLGISRDASNKTLNNLLKSCSQSANIITAETQRAQDEVARLAIAWLAEKESVAAPSLDMDVDMPVPSEEKPVPSNSGGVATSSSSLVKPEEVESNELPAQKKRKDLFGNSKNITFSKRVGIQPISAEGGSQDNYTQTSGSLHDPDFVSSEAPATDAPSLKRKV